MLKTFVFWKIAEHFFRNGIRCNWSQRAVWLTLKHQKRYSNHREPLKRKTFGKLGLSCVYVLYYYALVRRKLILLTKIPKSRENHKERYFWRTMTHWKAFLGEVFENQIIVFVYDGCLAKKKLRKQKGENSGKTKISSKIKHFWSKKVQLNLKIVHLYWFQREK